MSDLPAAPLPLKPDPAGANFMLLFIAITVPTILPPELAAA